MFNVHSPRGFTLVETLVAVLLLSVAVASAMSLVQKSIQASLYAKDQIVASYLAQDALEYVHNIRDNNNILINSGDPDHNWLQGLESCTKTTAAEKYCRIDTGQNNITTCGTSPSDCPVLSYNSINGYYGYYAAGPTIVATKFKRGTTIIPLTSNKEVIVRTVVSWKSGSIPRSILVEEHLFNTYGSLDEGEGEGLTEGGGGGGREE